MDPYVDEGLSAQPRLQNEKLEKDSVEVKELTDEEKLSDFERTEYLVEDYGHDVGIKVSVFAFSEAYLSDVGIL